MKHQLIGSSAHQLINTELLTQRPWWNIAKHWNDETVTVRHWDILQFVSCKPTLEYFNLQLVSVELQRFSFQVTQSWRLTVGLSGDTNRPSWEGVCYHIIIPTMWLKQTMCIYLAPFFVSHLVYVYLSFVLSNLCLHLTWLDFDLR